MELLTAHWKKFKSASNLARKKWFRKQVFSKQPGSTGVFHF